MAEELIEAPEVEEVIETEPVETETEEVVEGEAGEAGEKPEPGSEVEGGKLPLYKEAKPFLKDIQAKNPQLAAKIKASLIAIENHNRDFPEGTKQFKEAETAFSELADADWQGKTFPERVQLAKDEITFWRAFDKDISAGKPEVLDRWMEAAPDAFKSLAPEAFTRFSQVNPEGYSSYIGRVISSDMQESQLPVQFALLKTFIPQIPDGPAKEQVLSAVNEINKWFFKMQEFAKKPIVAPKTEAAPQVDKQAQETREMDLRRREWNVDATTPGRTLLNSEVSRLAGKNQLTDEQRRNIAAKVTEELDARLTANKDYGAAMRGYLKSGDQASYKKRLNSEYQKLIPSAVRRAYDDVVGAQKLPVKVKPNGTKTITPGVKPEAGVTRLAAYPAGGKIDLIKTTASMMRQNTAILKDGRKVSWPGKNSQ